METQLKGYFVFLKILNFELKLSIQLVLCYFYFRFSLQQLKYEMSNALAYESRHQAIVLMMIIILAAWCSG